MKVLIAGGGIGGLTLALMLHRRGMELRHLRTGVRDPGGRRRHHILPHAIKELAALDLLPKLDAAGIRTKELHYVSRLVRRCGVRSVARTRVSSFPSSRCIAADCRK